MSGLQLAEPKYFDFKMKAPFKLYLGTIDFRGECAFFVDLLIPTMTANKILPTVSSCGRFLHICYKIPEGFARFNETKNVPDSAVAGYRETISKIEDAYADLNEIMSDPPQVIGPLPCAIDSQFRHRGIVLDIPTCPEVFEELSQNMSEGMDRLIRYNSRYVLPTLALSATRLGKTVQPTFIQLSSHLLIVLALTLEPTYPLLIMPGVFM